VDLAIVRDAIAAGYGDDDLSAIAVYLRSNEVDVDRSKEQP
jgi:hypothetical protein